MRKLLMSLLVVTYAFMPLFGGEESIPKPGDSDFIGPPEASQVQS